MTTTDNPQAGNIQDDDIPAGQMSFVSFYEPGIEDGAYDVTISQDVTAPGASVTPVTQRLVVAGPRFALDPADVHANFPPAGSSGPFDHVLPHVVFNKRLLPWERAVPSLQPGTPWLALLVFQDGELLADPGTDPTKAAIAGYGVTTTVADLLAQASASVRVPDVTPDTPDEAAMNCQVISIDAATFAAIVPTGFELPYLAHGRNVNTDSKVLLDTTDSGMFSVVVSNRFPQPGTTTLGERCIVHLVSLEGFGDLLTGPTPQLPTQGTVKLVSLLTWSFSCLADPSQTFTGLAQNLAYDPSGNPWPATSLALRLPQPESSPTDQPSGPAAVAATRVADGYIAAGYHARSGEDGFAWYRGPCIPSVPDMASQPVPTYTSVSSAMIFDPESGVFDHSLAAAWQCGRSLALADQAFAAAMLRLRQTKRLQLHRLLVGDGGLPPVPDGGGDAAADHPDLRARLEGLANHAHDRLAALIRGGGLSRIAAASTGGAASLAAVPPPAKQPPAAPATRLRQLIEHPAVRAALGDVTDDPDAQSTAAWLANLCLLKGLPFDLLVPDARMLPAETVRWFYFDPAWVGAMLDGALTVGVVTLEESFINDTVAGGLAQAAWDGARVQRATALGLTPPAEVAWPLSGLLIRSALATGFPGTTIAASSNGQPVAILRFDIIAPNVFICLFNGVPDTVTLEQPHEGLAFGVDDEGAIVLRTVDGTTVSNGAQVVVFNPADPTLPTVRPGGLRVLNIKLGGPPSATPADLLGVIANQLPQFGGLITPENFALQMVKGPEVLTFSPNPPPEPGVATG